MRHVGLIERTLIRTKRIKVNVPESYSEMTAGQWSALCSMWREEVDEASFVVRFFGIDIATWSRLDTFYIYRLTDMLRDMSQHSDVNKFFAPYIRIGRNICYLPQPRLEGFTLMQYMAIDTLANVYKATRNRDILCHFIANLLAVRAEGVSVETLDKMVADAIDRPDFEKACQDIHLNYQLIQAWIAKRYPNVFPEGDGEEDAKPTVDTNGWSDVFDALVGDDLTRIVTYKTLPYDDVLRVLDGRIRDKKFKQ